MGEREKGHEYFVSGNRICSCGATGTFMNDGPSMGEQYMAHLASLEAQPEPATHYVENGTVSEFSDVQHFEEVAAHPSAGQSSDPTQFLVSDLLCPPHMKLDDAGHLEPFDNCIACIRAERDELLTRLTESRVAMREEAAKVAEKTLRPEHDTKREQLLRHFIVMAIRSLPADSSALDARDARVRLEEFLLIKRERPIDPVYWDMHHKRELEERIAQRSAEKGKCAK